MAIFKCYVNLPESKWKIDRISNIARISNGILGVDPSMDAMDNIGESPVFNR